MDMNHFNQKEKVKTKGKEIGIVNEIKKEEFSNCNLYLFGKYEL
jgi:hypothetical protein